MVMDRTQSWSVVIAAATKSANSSCNNQMRQIASDSVTDLSRKPAEARAAQLGWVMSYVNLVRMTPYSVPMGARQKLYDRL